MNEKHIIQITKHKKIKTKMKKFSILLAAIVIAAPAFAQFTPRTAHQFEDKANFSKIEKQLKAKASKSGAGEMVVNYLYALDNYLGGQSTTRHGYPLQYDSLGLFRSSSSAWHPNLHGWAQTFDFTNDDVWNYNDTDEDGAEIPTISLNQSASLNIDSVYIMGGYFREANTPAGTKDTLIVGFLTDLDTNDLMTLTYTGSGEIACRFYAVGYDAATGVQTNAVVVKYPMGDEQVCEVDETGSYYPQIYSIPVGIENIAGKVWNVAYTFKRGYDINLNDTLYNYSHFTAFIFQDPRADYSFGSEELINNMNQGGFVDTDIRYDLHAETSWMFGIYGPSVMWHSTAGFDYPYLGLYVSCNDCEWVGVEEMAKENLTVYPNPATNNINVSTGSDKQMLVELFNLVGQRVYSENVVNSTVINVSNLKAGVYLLKANNRTAKVIVK